MKGRIGKKIQVRYIDFSLSNLEGGDKGSLWYRYQLTRYQVPPKLKVLVPPILGEGTI